MKNFLLAPAVTLLFSAPLFAQSLAELAAQSGQEWMLGKWATVGGEATVSYEWKLEKHAVSMKLKMGSRESEGMSVLDPKTHAIVFAAADNSGGVTTGVWTEEEGHLMLKASHQDANGTETKMAFEHIQKDANTMTVRVFGLTASGALESAPKMEVIYKRVP